jgi:hypothetical protein
LSPFSALALPMRPPCRPPFLRRQCPAIAAIFEVAVLGACRSARA